MDYGDCSTLSTNKIITAEENNRKLIINNPSAKKINKVKVDGCLIKQTECCDYLFEVFEVVNQQEKISLVIYLELKGSDIEKAYKQLLTTCEYFKTQRKGIVKHCYIIATKISYPNFNAQKQKWITEMKRKANAEPFFCTRCEEITV